MTFIITFIALMIERFLHWHHLRHWRWFNTYQQWLSHSRMNRLPAFLLFLVGIIPFVIIVAGINYFLTGWLYDSLKLVFGIIILVYSFGPENLWLQVYACINQLHTENSHAAIENIKVNFGIPVTESPQAFHQAFTRAIFLAAYYRIFGVIFWFVLLGPAGAVLYRLTVLMSTESPLGLTQMTKTILRGLDWIPIRILTFIFALGGHFSKVFAQWKKFALKSPQTNETLLTECGIAALDVMTGIHMPEDGAAEREAILLLDRVFVMGLVILAILVLLL